MTRGTTGDHLILAALESIAHQSADVIEQMKRAGTTIRELKVDGGATRNSFLMQLQADLLQIPVLVSEHSESTAWGAAKLAGHCSGVWESLSALDGKMQYKRFIPRKNLQWVKQARNHWKREISRAIL
jgi:glycerol kinase